MFQSSSPTPRLVGAIVAVVALGGALGGYAVHEHTLAQNSAANNRRARPDPAASG
jgi:hypothetical protein